MDFWARLIQKTKPRQALTSPRLLCIEIMTDDFEMRLPFEEKGSPD